MIVLPFVLFSALLTAGNTADEGERLRLLRAMPGADAARLVEVIQRFQDLEAWLQALPDDERLPHGDDCFGIAPASELYPLACFYEGRLLIGEAVEGFDDESLLAPAFARARKDFEHAQQAFPANPLIGMYLGTPIPNAIAYADDPAAPAWANREREALERLADVVHWWIAHRQRPDASYGGGWGDDCEMWRWWAPLLLAFDDPVIQAAQERFSEALLARPYLKDGYYSKKLTDVEHSAEDLSDALTPMMHLKPQDPRWLARTRRLTELAERLWMGRDARGFLHFKSTYFTAAEVDPSPAHAADTAYHPRVLQAPLLYWQRTGDARTGALVTAWMRGWVDAAMRAENGKPAGVIPTAIHWPDGAVGGEKPPWWDPKNHSEPALYRWPSAVDLVAETLLLTFQMTGDRSFLAPVQAMAAMKGQADATAPAGSAGWVAARLDVLDEVLPKLHLLEGRPDAPLGERKLAERLAESAAALRVNFAAYTSEVRNTDRVLQFPRIFRPGRLFAEGRPGAQAKAPDTGLLYRLASGDAGNAGYFPLNAVRWRTPPRAVAARVVRATGRTLAAEAFHFGDRPRALAVEFLRLEPGEYELTGAGRPVRFTKTAAPAVVPLTLPPRALVRLTVARR